MIDREQKRVSGKWRVSSTGSAASSNQAANFIEKQWKKSFLRPRGGPAEFAVFTVGTYLTEIV